MYPKPSSPSTAVPVFMVNASDTVAATGEPATHAAAVTPNDGVDLPSVSRAFYIGVSGNLSVVMAGGETATFVGLPTGGILPIQATRVRATGTTATSIVALW